MSKLLLVFASFIAIASAKYFDSSSSSCEDHRHHGRYHGGGHNYNGNYNGGHIKKKPVCEDGWKFFERPSGGWCIKSFANGIMTKYAAEAKCNVLDATVSGLQNKAEIDYIESQLSVLIAGLRGSAWIGGTRINSCIGKPMGGECTPSTAFTWTDKSATGTDGLWWNDRQPDNFKLIQDCMVLSNAEVPVVWSGGASWVSGRLDDLACDDFAVAYVCGKRPTLK